MCSVPDADDAKTIFTGSFDGRICAWEVATGNGRTLTEEDAIVENLISTKDSLLYTVQKREDLLKKIDLNGYSTK